MVSSDINFGGKCIALTLLALYCVGYMAIVAAIGFLVIDITFIVSILFGLMLCPTCINTAALAIKYFVLCLLITLADVLMVVLLFVIIPYLVHKLRRYNWLIYMCNCCVPNISDILLHIYSPYVQIEIFSQLESTLELDLFQERLLTKDYDAVTLLLSYKNNRSRKLELTVHYMNHNSKYQYIRALLNNQYYLADIFNALGNLGENINLQFVDALLEHGGNEIRPEYFDVRIRSNRMILLDHILTKLGPTNNPNILDKLDAYLTQILSAPVLNIDNVRTLLKHGANPNTDNGNLIIKYAKQESMEILDALFQYGGDLTINDHYIFKYSTLKKKRTLATYLANKYSFYSVLHDGDNLIGTISTISATKNANN